MSSSYANLDRPPLDARALRRALVAPGSMWTEIDVVAETASTNADLVARSATEGGTGLVLVAEHQTSGRGRLARVWTAPPRSGVTMSVLIRPPGVPVSRWPWLPLLTGLAVAAAVRSQAEVEAELKWPNDVMVGDKKLAGILVERAESPAAAPAAVIGIGLNVSLAADELPVPGATSLLLEQAVTIDRSLLIRAILRRLDGLVAGWQRGLSADQEQLRRAYQSACTTLGQSVRIDLPGGATLVGRATDVDEVGRLLVQTPEGLQAVGAGDVVHLRPSL